jgi:hypothetical protein
VLCISAPIPRLNDDADDNDGSNAANDDDSANDDDGASDDGGADCACGHLGYAHLFDLTESSEDLANDLHN